MNHKILATAVMLAAANMVQAQTGADYIQAYGITDCTIPFDVSAEGKPFRVNWGMDTAWDWDYNVNRGIAHIGKQYLTTGRVSFQPIDLVTDNGNGTYTLSSRQQNRLQARINLIKRTGTQEINLNCDHEVLFKKVDNRGYCTEADDPTGKKNYVGKPEEWYKLIKATTQYCQKQGLKVISVSPFNEPDYTAWQQYTGAETNGMKDFAAIAKLIKEDPFFEGIRVCGGNTLNCDRALPWYNSMKQYLDEGNTHQLAGSFDNYANFFATVKQDGKVATADELHNVGEAIVGVEYGMENGIWWGFDAKARGQFCIDSNEGVRIGYGEDRPHWTVGAVYRNDVTGEVHGYVGSSERQANKSSYTFVSPKRDVFFNGYGPTRQWVYNSPGGTGYQLGQINAEKLFDITWGEDVAPLPEVNGTYMIVNQSSNYPLTYTNGANVQTASRKSTGTTQHWNVYPSYTDGDCSYWFIDNAGVPTAHLNLRNMNLNAGAEVMTFDAGHGHEEQWYVKYAGNGYYYIIARLSNKYLYCTSTASGATVKLMDAPAANTTQTSLKKYYWRFQPVDSKCETKAPGIPVLDAARQRTASIALEWTSPADEDFASVTLLRASYPTGGDETTAEWNTIARQLTGTTFMDNNVQPGYTYMYKMFAVDYVGNRSKMSDVLTAAPIGDKALNLQLQFDDDTTDKTDNHLNAVLNGKATYSSTDALHRSGTKSLQLTGSTYLQLPYEVADQDEMTVAAWVRWDGGSNQRIFDFGNDADHSIYLSPGGDGHMRFVIKNGDEEVVAEATSSLSSLQWRHLAVTVSPGKIVLYQNGEEKAVVEDPAILPTTVAPGINYIGRSHASATFFKGRLDDFRIYNYALSADEVMAIMDDTGEISAQYKDQYTDISPTAIHTATVTGNAVPEAVYTVDGKRVATAQKGINVIRMNDGAVKKVLVK